MALVAKRSQHFIDFTRESSSWNKKSHVFEDAKLEKRLCFSHQLVVPRETVWCFAVQEEPSEVELKKVISLAHWAVGDAPNHVKKLLQPLKAIQEVKDGGRINFLIQGKKFLLLIYIIFKLSLLWINHPASLALYNICEHFLLWLENAKMVSRKSNREGNDSFSK